MNKRDLLQHIIKQLEAVHQNAIAAAERAHSSATDKENVAENKYDTLGLEAAYLAEGQSRRVAECEEELKAFQRLLGSVKDEPEEIKIGSFVTLEDEQGVVKNIFLAVCAGGLKINYQSKEVMLVTASAPLGKALLGLGIDDEITLKHVDEDKHYQVLDCV
ncbi:MULTISPECIES: GreA/GreB family elongation factor [unclassified Neptuniibacter]|uniref:GreA/GreB family elongation factor n=1 Tax=unclassified Neptuniibacter TaxID=2630693 RepID=UPI000C63EE40|nr:MULTISPECIES: GreA/GreB family elongation factor [unclassified Neptuniibacter]MAY41639.1 transcription elongation factor [Oceanospirillaceae bacterium]|tara:strand:+ start:19002 stop:19484 length:483 start_codon:yes stop_codon:yes gene_type:complete